MWDGDVIEERGSGEWTENADERSIPESRGSKLRRSEA
jgi:hypothetical protein